MQINLPHLAKLAKLSLSEDEQKRLATQLPAILDYVAKLQEVDTSGIDPKAYLTDAVNVFRADEPKAYPGERDAVVKAFPKKSGDALQVPAIFE